MAAFRAGRAYCTNVPFLELSVTGRQMDDELRVTWIAVRVWGERKEPRDMTVAQSGQIYTVVGDEPTWKREAVPELLARHRAQLPDAALRADRCTAQQDLETWDTATNLVERWREQRARLEPRVTEADRRYRELLERFENSGSGADAGQP